MARRRSVLASILAASALVGPPAESFGSPPAPKPTGGSAAAPHAPSDKGLDRVAEEAASAEVDRSVIAGPLGEARRALGRAAGARASGDAAHAAMLDRLAGEWTDVARTLVRAARVEGSARTEAERARELGVRLERARALVVEQQAHRWRLRAELERARTGSVAPAGAAGLSAPAPRSAAKGAARAPTAAAPAAGARPGGAP